MPTSSINDIEIVENKVFKTISINYKFFIMPILILSIFVLGNLFVIQYILKENYIYFWDISGFWTSGIDFSKVLFTNPIEALHQLYNSILQMDYNLLPVIPLCIVTKLINRNNRSTIMNLFSILY